MTAVKLNKIGLDPLGLGGLLDGLLDVGIPQESLFAVPQGHKLMGYIMTTRAKTCRRQSLPCWARPDDLVRW